MSWVLEGKVDLRLLEKVNSDPQGARLLPVVAPLPPPGRDCRYKAAPKSDFKLPWRQAGPLNHQSDKVKPGHKVVNNEGLTTLKGGGAANLGRISRK